MKQTGWNLQGMLFYGIWIIHGENIVSICQENSGIDELTESNANL